MCLCFFLIFLLVSFVFYHCPVWCIFRVYWRSVYFVFCCSFVLCVSGNGLLCFAVFRFPFLSLPSFLPPCPRSLARSLAYFIMVSFFPAAAIPRPPCSAVWRTGAVPAHYRFTPRPISHPVSSLLPPSVVFTVLLCLFVSSIIFQTGSGVFWTCPLFAARRRRGGVAALFVAWCFCRRVVFLVVLHCLPTLHLIVGSCSPPLLSFSSASSALSFLLCGLLEQLRLSLCLLLSFSTLSFKLNAAALPMRAANSLVFFPCLALLPR